MDEEDWEARSCCSNGSRTPMKKKLDEKNDQDPVSKDSICAVEEKKVHTGCQKLCNDFSRGIRVFLASEYCTKAMLYQVGMIYMFAVANSLVHNDVCNLMFKCGCPSIWALWHCNNLMGEGIDHVEMSMRCPWCQPWHEKMVTAGWFHLWDLHASFDQYGIVVTALYVSPWKWKLIAFAVANLSVALVYKLIFDYPYFIGFGRNPAEAPANEFFPPKYFHGDWVIMLFSRAFGTVIWVLLFVLLWQWAKFMLPKKHTAAAPQPLLDSTCSTDDVAATASIDDDCKKSIPLDDDDVSTV